MRARLNLASRPFRNESLPNLLFVLGGALLIVVTYIHAWHLQRLVGAPSSALRREVTGLDAELQAVRHEAQAKRVSVPEQSRLAEWRAVKDLVDRRTLSWSVLLSRLEAVLPANARLLSISPTVNGGQIHIELQAVAKTREDGYELIKALEAEGHFDDVFPVSLNTSPRGEEFEITVRYLPTAQADRKAGA
jgi:Tfp pilus assembly protein PilN